MKALILTFLLHLLLLCGRKTTQAFRAATPSTHPVSQRVIVSTKSSALYTAASTPPSPQQQQQQQQQTSTRRDLLLQTPARLLLLMTAPSLVWLTTTPSEVSHAATPRMDVNNALAREYTAFPGLFPTIATKIVKNGPYQNKKEVYAVLNEIEQERLKQYDSSIVIQKPDAQLKQFKNSQICKYECGSRVSNEYRDEQIRQVQKARR